MKKKIVAQKYIVRYNMYFVLLNPIIGINIKIEYKLG